MSTKNVNIRMIAEKVGVSVASISRALQEPPSKNISPKLRERILKTCEEMRYYPNMHTVRMFSKRSNTVAMFAPADIVHMGPTGMVDFNLSAAIGGVEYELSRNSMYLTLASVSESFVEKRECLKFSRGKLVDGLIIWGWVASDEYIDTLANEDIPIVMIRSDETKMPLDSVRMDEYGGMSRMAERVAEAGHVKVGVIRPILTSWVGKMRLAGFLDSAQKLGLDIVFSESGGFDYEVGLRATDEILAKDEKVTCLVAPNDVVAFACVECAEKKGLSVPGDISVTGADGVTLPGTRRLATFLSPSFDMGRSAVSTLLKRIAGDES
ncbi:MAG: LacI family DNA-binding transcriptional regulator, partial [Victivallales bacterium]|nr:LacI family DNA-binding transcriptional regulator [Victivallales bacterium]